MITFGLTGGIASGKSAVAKTFLSHNIPIVDADVIAREVVEPGTQGLKQLINAFGEKYLNEDGSLNRTDLGELVFFNKEAMAEINSIMAPLIRAEADLQINKKHSDGYPIVGYDAALIVEQGEAKKYTPLIVVSCPLNIQVSRLMSRNVLTYEAAMARIESQFTLQQKLDVADFVIDTSGKIENSINSTKLIISLLKEQLHGRN